MGDGAKGRWSALGSHLWFGVGLGGIFGGRSSLRYLFGRVYNVQSYYYWQSFSTVHPHGVVVQWSVRSSGRRVALCLTPLFLFWVYVGRRRLSVHPFAGRGIQRAELAVWVSGGCGLACGWPVRWGSVGRFFVGFRSVCGVWCTVATCGVLPCGVPGVGWLVGRWQWCLAGGGVRRGSVGNQLRCTWRVTAGFPSGRQGGERHVFVIFL